MPNEIHKTSAREAFFTEEQNLSGVYLPHGRQIMFFSVRLFLLFYDISQEFINTRDDPHVEAAYRVFSGIFSKTMDTKFMKNTQFASTTPIISQNDHCICPKT